MGKTDRGPLGEWLAQKCDQERLSLRHTAAKTGLSHATIRDIKCGVRPIPETISKLAHAFGGNGEQEQVLQDKLLVLAGYRTEPPDCPQPSEAFARLRDQLKTLNEAQLKIVSRFVDFLAVTEVDICSNRQSR